MRRPRQRVSFAWPSVASSAQPVRAVVRRVRRYTAAHGRRLDAARIPRHWPGPGADAADGSDSLVPPCLPLGPDQHHRERSRPLRHRLVARLLEADRGPGRHRQRRRHRRLLPEPVPAAPSRRVPRRTRSLRRADQGGARRRAVRDGADGLEPDGRGFLRGASRLVRARSRRAPDPRRRQVCRLHQQSVLRRLPSRRAARDHRTLASGRVHRQQLGGAGAREHLLLRQLRTRVPDDEREGAAARRGLERPRLPRLDHVELRAAYRGLGSEQPRDTAGRRRRLHLGRHEQADRSPRRPGRSAT